MSEKIISRIKKMLALASNEAASEGERDNAMRMIYTLLAKHNLSMNDIDATEAPESRERQEFVVSADKWARDVSNSVAKLFFCKYFFMRTRTSGRDQHCFVGKQSNVATCVGMSEYLIASIKREATKRYKSPTSPEGRSFCVGATLAIWVRVREMLEKDVDAQPGTALVVVNLRKQEEDANIEWLQSNGTTLVAKKERADNSIRASAYFNGKDYGSKVSLNNQVGTTTSGRKQLT